MENGKVIKVGYCSTVNVKNKATEEAYNLITYAQTYATKQILNIRKKTAARLFKTRQRCRLNNNRQREKFLAIELSKRLKEQMLRIDDYLAELKQDCFETALQIVHEILEEETKNSSTYLYKKLETALATVTDRHDIRIFVNPNAIQELLAYDQKLKAYLISNELIPYGNAVINSPIGQTEISWQKHLELLSEIVFSRLSK